MIALLITILMLYFQGDHLNRLLRLDMSGGKEEFALDIRHSAVQVTT